ncbi:serine protease [bacterium]|nr:serine protease [bacterium]
MKTISIIFILSFYVQLFAGERVIGGAAITGDQAPWQLSLQSKSGTHFCGAALIREDVLLTAAHCVWTDDASTVRIKGKSSPGKLKELSSLPGIKDIIVHPDFDPNDVVAHDLAVILLSSKITTTNTLKPIAIPGANFPYTLDKEFHNLFDIDLVVSGWGMTTPPNLLQEPSEQLMAANLKAVASSNISLLDPKIQKYLIDTYEINEKTIDRLHSLNSRTLFAEGRSSIGGPCAGDSGGPLVMNLPSGPVLIGISSYTAGGKKQCLGFGAFTNLQAYADWIALQIN